MPIPFKIDKFLETKPLDIFHRVPKKFGLGDCIIMFNSPFKDGTLETEVLLSHPFIEICGMKTEGKLFGYYLKVPEAFAHRAVNGSIFSASRTLRLGTPHEIIKIFSGRNFSTFTDDLEQGVLNVSSTPHIADVQKG